MTLSADVLPSPPSTPPPRLVVSAGSVCGREHLRLHRNNQDGVAVLHTDDRLSAVVTDGCSQGHSSEVGARLGAEWLVRRVHRAFQHFDCVNQAATALHWGLLTYLDTVARGVAPRVRDYESTLARTMLFTYLVATMTAERTTVFGVGDGLYAIDDEVHILDPGSRNAPQYATYDLLERGAGPVLHADVHAPRGHSVVIATDGAAELEGELFEWANAPGVNRNPRFIQRRLVATAENKRRPFDDTSIVVLRRESCGRSKGNEK